MVADDSFRTVGKGIDMVEAAISLATGVGVVVECRLWYVGAGL